MAADHQDGTFTGTGAALLDPSVDITDIFAWMSPDTTTSAGTVNLIMDVFPNASSTSLFSTTAKYVFHTGSQAAALTSVISQPSAANLRDIICTFAGTSAPQTATCYVANGTTTVEYATGLAGTAASPLISASTKLKVFAGPRNDPFFFNLVGFRNATSTVAEAIAAYTGSTPNKTYITGFDSAVTGCPILSNQARTTVAGYLTKDCTGLAAGKDFFRVPVTADNADCIGVKPTLVNTAQTANEGFTGNVLSLVVTVDKSLLTSGGPLLSVWGATTK